MRVKDLLPGLFEEGILSDYDKKKLEKKETDEEAVSMLIDEVNPFIY